MFTTAHLAAGLIIGKLTNNYTAALIGASVMDLDHIISLVRHRIITSPNKFLKTIINAKDKYKDQRNILHTLLAWAIISAAIFWIDTEIAFVFSLAYLSHLLLDVFDGSDMQLFYPFSNVNIKGPIRYFSRSEATITSILLLISFFI